MSIKSGCVTSAEAVLVGEQSERLVYEMMKDKDNMMVFSLSAQSIASIAVHFETEYDETALLISRALRRAGAARVFDVAYARRITLQAQAEEFIERYNARKESLPMLSASCPAWVCIAEKTRAQALPYMSDIRSPQQLLGALIKRWWGPHLKIRHVTVMPCADKKLEAARAGFGEDEKSRDVDCALTSDELLRFFQLCEISLVDDKNEDGSTCCVFDSPFHNVGPTRPEGVRTVSGGNMDYIFQTACRQLFDVKVFVDHDGTYKVVCNEEGIENGAVHQKVMRGGDVVQLTLMVNGLQVLRFGAAYGLRNVHNVVNTLDAKSGSTHYIEVMACPGGCVGGGGQIKDENSHGNARHRVRKVTAIYEGTPAVHASKAQGDIEMCARWLRTTYKAVVDENRAFTAW